MRWLFRAQNALGRGYTEKYGISSCRYAGECGRIDDCCFIPDAEGSGIAVEITEKKPRGGSVSVCN